MYTAWFTCAFPAVRCTRHPYFHAPGRLFQSVSRSPEETPLRLRLASRRHLTGALRGPAPAARMAASRTVYYCPSCTEYDVTHGGGKPPGSAWKYGVRRITAHSVRIARFYAVLLSRIFSPGPPQRLLSSLTIGSRFLASCFCSVLVFGRPFPWLTKDDHGRPVGGHNTTLPCSYKLCRITPYGVRRAGSRALLGGVVGSCSVTAATARERLQGCLKRDLPQPLLMFLQALHSRRACPCVGRRALSRIISHRRAPCLIASVRAPSAICACVPAAAHNSSQSGESAREHKQTTAP